MSAFRTSEFAARAKAAGFATVLEKTFKDNALLTILERLIGEPIGSQATR